MVVHKFVNFLVKLNDCFVRNREYWILYELLSVIESWKIPSMFEWFKHCYSIYCIVWSIVKSCAALPVELVISTTSRKSDVPFTFLIFCLLYFDCFLFATIVEINVITCTFCFTGLTSADFFFSNLIIATFHHEICTHLNILQVIFSTTMNQIPGHKVYVLTIESNY